MLLRLATAFSLVAISAWGGPRNDVPAVFRDGVVLIKFRAALFEGQAAAILGSVGASEIKRLGVGVHMLNVGPGRVASVIQALKVFSDIVYAEPDYLHTVDGGPVPNDAFVGNQWAIQNTGQTVNGVTGTTGADERLPAAWRVTTGSNAVVVAVLDTGVQYSHPDLATNIWNNPGGIGGCPPGTHGYNVLNATCDPMDDENSYGGHGTHVAGILGAVGNNASGVAGVNWTTSIMALKWVTASDSGFTSDLIAAMDWVIKAKQAGVNVRIINDSATWPGTGFSQALSDEIDLAGANDILFVTAAGNTAQNNDTIPRYPCSLNRPSMICVAASDQNDNLWSSSNYGTTTVQLAAPGVNVYSTLRLSNYGYISGCSMASPQVAGTAALILSLGYASVPSLKAIILNNVDPLASLSSYVVTGGRLNVCKAVPGCSSALSATPVPTAPPVIVGSPQSGAILGASTGVWSGSPSQYLYQWYRCAGNGASCSPIAGATGQSYAALAVAETGGTFVVTVAASNTSGSAIGQSTASGVVQSASSPFTIGSTIQDGATVGGTLQWQATPAQAVNFVQFYLDGVLKQTISSSPYVYTFDSTTLSNGTHLAGIRALSNDNRTYGFYGATVNVGTIITKSGGDGQSALPGQPFSAPLQVTVKDVKTNPLPGTMVTFSATASGPSGTFAGGVLSTTAITNNSGIAIAPTFTANGTAGVYNVSASVGALAPLTFALTNTFTSPPTADAVTPNAGSGVSQNFTFKYSSANGSGYLTSVYGLIHSSINGAGGCLFQYYAPGGALYLYNDAGNGVSGTLTTNVATSISNSQCTISGSGFTASGSGNQLTLTIPIAFSNSFIGLKNVYGYASDQGGLNSGWQQLGTWTARAVANTPPTADAVSPSSGSASSQTFAFKYSSANGSSYLSSVYGLIHSSINGAGGCFFQYYAPTSTLYLFNDAGNGVAGTLTPGSATSINNSQCTISGGTFTASGSGKQLTLTIPIAFSNSFIGLKNVYGYASDQGSLNSGWQQLGTWTAHAVANTPPTADSVSPSAGTGAGPTLTFEYSSPNGSGYLSAVYGLIHTSINGAGGCFFQYYAPGGTLYLYNDAGNGVAGTLTPGAVGSINNSQCTISGGTFTASRSGNQLTLAIPITFSNTFTGAKNVYGYASDQGSLNSGWQQLGSWTR